MPEAAGCVITSSDTPIIISSCACFASFIVYGACNASLGPAVPALSEALAVPKAAIGILFFTRGMGFLLGTVCSAAAVTSSYYTTSSKTLKATITSWFCLLMGVASGLMIVIPNYYIFIILTVFQGISFGVIDTLANCLLPELWGARVQPWMQALHLFFGVGAIFGPFIVGMFDFDGAFATVFIASFLPITIISLRGLRFTAASIQGSQDFSSDYSKLPTTEGVEMREVESTNTITDTESAASSDDFYVVGKETTVAADGATASGVPKLLRILICAFYFIYAGAESGFAGWISVYSLDAGIATSSTSAAWLSSVFWALLTIGRLIAVFTAIFISATTMIRIQLALSVIATTLFWVFGRNDYLYAVVISGILGYAYSSIYPLMMTLVIDYGYTMDPTATTWFMLGATFGEALMPMAFGLLIEFIGYATLPSSVWVCTLILVFIYGLAHRIGHSNSSIATSNAAADMS